jgi:hypothetical protein
MQMGIVPRTHRAICEDPLRLLKPQLNRRDSNSGLFLRLHRIDTWACRFAIIVCAHRAGSNMRASPLPTVIPSYQTSSRPFASHNSYRGTGTQPLTTVNQETKSNRRANALSKRK